MRNPFYAPDEFRTDELAIRAYRMSDAEALQEAVVSSYEHLSPWMPWASTTQTVAACQELCRQFAMKHLANEDFVLGIWQGDVLAGGTGFHLRCGPLASGAAEIGMWIRGDRAGKGLGTGALLAMLQWGFTVWEWDRLVWKCDTRNFASARVAEKAGMRLEGTFRSDAIGVDRLPRDTHQFAMLREEWSVRGARFS